MTTPKESSKSSRNQILRKILKLNPDSFIITSPGYISRELYKIKDSPRHFYMQGAMGCTLGFAMGLAMNTDNEIVAVVGDGDLLMSLGSLALCDRLMLNNLTVYILDNGQYQSTGGQKTCSEGLKNWNIRMGHNVFTSYINDKGKIPPRIGITHKEIARRFYEELNSTIPIN